MGGKQDPIITISLDEFGEFEKKQISIKDKLVFVGGILYKSPNLEDTKNEYRRVAAFFQEVCKEANTRYPEDLHISNRDQNCGQVARTKNCYTKHLGEFLRKGTYAGQSIAEAYDLPNRNEDAEYYIYEILRTIEGKQHLVQRANISDFIKETELSNLYLHMAEEALLRTILHNPLIPNIKNVNIDLATRASGDLEKQLMERYSDEGMEVRSGRRAHYAELTNSYVFRTTLEREMLNDDQTDLNVLSFQTRSIKYGKATDGTENTPDMEMLYLADAVCTCLGQKTISEDQKLTYDDHYAEKAFRSMKYLISKKEQCLLFLHDDADLLYAKILRFANAADLYHAASVLYDLEHLDTEGGEFYRHHWTTILCEHLKKTVTESTLTAAIRKLTESTKNNNMEVPRLEYIFGCLNQMVPLVNYPNEQDKSILFDLYDSGVSIYNHLAQSAKAEECRNKSLGYEQFFGVTQRIRSRNKNAVALGDKLEFTEAERISKQNVAFYENMLELEEKNLEKKSAGDEYEYGVALSQYAQILAFQGKAAAKDSFQNALQQMPDQTPDYFITYSYFLHDLIDRKDQEAYEKNAKHYFGDNETLLEQLDYVLKEGGREHNALISLKFALYVLVKAADTFYAHKLRPEEYLALISVDKKIMEKPGSFLSKQVTGHPWELIYRHIASIAWIHGKEEKLQREFQKKIQDISNHHGDIISKICDASVQEIDARLKGHEYTYPKELRYMYR